MKNDRSAKNGEYPTLVAEHADGWHDALPHPNCRECKRADRERRAYQGRIFDASRKVAK